MSCDTENIMRITNTTPADITCIVTVSVQPVVVAGAPKWQAGFHLDSTLVTMEMIAKLGAELGLQKPVDASTSDAMTSRLYFSAKLAQVVALLHVNHQNALDVVFQRSIYTTSARVLTPSAQWRA